MDGNGKQTGSTVLVVDDVPASRHALGTVLRRAGHSVVPVGSGGEALDVLDVRVREGTLPDVALVDVRLPDMSGFELCRRLKSSPPTAALPVVHFSAASAGSGLRCRGLDSGGEAYLSVPAEPEEIQAVVRAAVRGARMRTGAEALARRLTLLSETIVSVQAARRMTELVRAAAEGTARITGLPAVAFVLGDDDELYRGLSRPRTSAGLPDAEAHDTVARLIRGLTAGHPGARGTVVPHPLWPPGFLGSGRPGDARVVVTRTREGKPAVCLAVPARGSAAECDALLARLAQATALAAEALLMYQVERHVALTLQHSFLPQQAPSTQGLETVVRYVPASRQTEIGGDFYAALTTSRGVLTAVGDIAGHSLDAATVMVEIRHALRAYCVENPDPESLARRLDRLLQHFHPEVTATVCLALVEPGSGHVRIANAGHIPPLIVHDDGTAEYAAAKGPLLGLGLDRPPAAETVLRPADRMLMVTDGLIESRGTDLAVSLEQLRTAAAEAPPGVDTLCDTLLDRFGRDREDDIALLALRRTGLG